MNGNTSAIDAPVFAPTPSTTTEPETTPGKAHVFGTVWHKFAATVDAINFAVMVDAIGELLQNRG